MGLDNLGVGMGRHDLGSEYKYLSDFLVVDIERAWEGVLGCNFCSSGSVALF